MRGRPFDVIANRTLVFVVLTALGVITYALVVAVIGPQVPARGADAVLLGAALAAVLLAVRNLAQRGVDWLLYGDRHDPNRVVLRVGRSVESVHDPVGLMSVLAETLARSLRLSHVEVRLLESGSVTTIGSRTSRVTELPLMHRGRVVGDLTVGRRGETLSRADLKLVGGVATQLAAAAQTLLLNDRLVAAREQLVRAREEERRRLHRDLHDILGPALAGVGLGLDAARSRARRDLAGADQLIQQVQGEVRDCVGEVRRIIDGLRPPALDERGLVGALEHQAQLLSRRQPYASIEVVAAQLPALPAAVEVVAYLIAQEALINAIRHARASRITVDLRVNAGELLLEIVDNGVGLPPAGKRPGDGVGLPSIMARAEEIGGRAGAESDVGSGTRISARLPLRLDTP